MDLGSLLAAYMTLSGAHTLNHLSVADKTGAPATISEFGEKWQRPKDEYSFSQAVNKTFKRPNPNSPGYYEITKELTKTPLPSPNESERNGAGFEGQDVVNNLINSPESNLANAIYKGLYLTGIGTSGTYKDGDIGGVSANSGMSKDKIKGLIGASALADLIRAYRPKDNWNLQFDITGGRPGLVYTKRW